MRVAVEASTENQNAGADFVIRRSDGDGWKNAAQWLSESGVKFALLQHEFKIFGGDFGSDILGLLEERPCSFVTTLHTVSRRVRGRRLEVLQRICALSECVVVHTSESKRVLHSLDVDWAKIHVIPHGVPTLPFEPPGVYQSRDVVRPLFLSFGHLRRSKGYELALNALARLRDDRIAFQYWICGKDHPRPKSAATYRTELVAKVAETGLQDHVRFIDNYLTSEQLARIVKACDVGILPYKRVEQASSGTLPFFFACGRPVVASAFRAACEIVDSECGRLFPVNKVDDLYRALKEIASAPQLRAKMMLCAHEKARAWGWHIVANEYMNILGASVTSGVTGRLEWFRWN